MLRGTWYYNKEIKVENVIESAKIVTNVQTVPFLSGMFVNVYQRSFVTILALSTTFSTFISISFCILSSVRIFIHE